MKALIIKVLSICVFGLVLSVSAYAQDNTADQATSEAQPPVAPRITDADALDQLQAAYQKEYAFLEAQLRDLRQRSADFGGDSSRSEADKEAQIDRMEGEWINLQSEAERLQTMQTEA